MKLTIIPAILMVLLSLALHAQDEKPKTALGGYLKYMPSFDVTHGLDSTLANQLLHNRLDFIWFANKNLYFRFEMRNRIFHGDYVNRLGYFKQLVDVNNDQFDLSLWVIDGNSVKMLSELDRAYMKFTGKKWEITAGRHRINWGVNNIWNPNDIFNAYSFFNFDYEERPASDALNFTYHFGHSSKLEIATKFADNMDDYTGAVLWKVIQSGYEVQMLAGLMENNVVVGTGWSGHIKTVGFKGEVSYFSALNVLDNDALVASFSADYTFGENAYVLGSYFYNSSGVKDLNMSNFALVSAMQPPNAKDLLPFTSAVLLQIAEPLSPEIYASMTTIWFPGNDSGFFGPGLAYSASNNLTLDFISQVFTVRSNKLFDPASFKIFFRAKWKLHSSSLSPDPGH